MGSWNEILEEIKTNNNNVDLVRRTYLKKLSNHTGRNTILYYSGWLEKPQMPGTDITDLDMPGFMTTVNKLNKSQGVDIILHSPGGDPTATEHIVNYLHSVFNNDVRVIVPHMAMSAGTMFACAAKEIIMGKQSCLGPVDPQFGGIPAFNIIEEFKNAKKELTDNPQSSEYWRQLLSKYPAAFLYRVFDAMKLSKILVQEWLEKYMFKDENKTNIIKEIVKKLNMNAKSHARHFSLQYCIDMGLKIVRLEDDAILQDLVLSIYHASTITISSTRAIKLIENQEGRALIRQI
ncbi:MAG TPA: ATP-dependent Clp protease proteolytic subunit [Bacilli bacterium]|nr:MAG: Serine dehydrogenase proteinase [Tenericutes bacterium ADurb.BinA124]HNZ50621.1 ATP-dependent Clp protease proteolytic subunit [Bacilli bacterium]HPX83860.1 ATP-dependent Clp protease proteolytic subunit [Bacilli bacterium]